MITLHQLIKRRRQLIVNIFNYLNKTLVSNKSRLRNIFISDLFTSVLPDISEFYLSKIIIL